jgi:hypothetical protein
MSFGSATKALIGYRDDCDLEYHWWHRLFKVLLVVSACLLFIYAFNEAGHPEPTRLQRMRRISPAWHPEDGLIGGLIATAIYVTAMCNLYYRGVVYVIKGPKD